MRFCSKSIKNRHMVLFLLSFRKSHIHTKIMNNHVFHTKTAP